jgi:hypothetical protein
MLCLCEQLPQFSDFKSEIVNLKSRAKNISSQLFGWIESLKNSDIKGEKFFTEKERSIKAKREDWQEFKKELEESQRVNIESSRRNYERSKPEKE